MGWIKRHEVHWRKPLPQQKGKSSYWIFLLYDVYGTEELGRGVTSIRRWNECGAE
jgi:hypothetical protein